MSKYQFSRFNSLISVLFIVFTLLLIVFFQMEERRWGYELLKLSRDHRELLDEKRKLEIQLAKLTRPQHVEKIAQSKLTLKKINTNQIIHLANRGTRLPSDISKSVKKDKN